MVTQLTFLWIPKLTHLFLLEHDWGCKVATSQQHPEFFARSVMLTVEAYSGYANFTLFNFQTYIFTFPFTNLLPSFWFPAKVWKLHNSLPSLSWQKGLLFVMKWLPRGIRHLPYVVFPGLHLQQSSNRQLVTRDFLQAQTHSVQGKTEKVKWDLALPSQ